MRIVAGLIFDGHSGNLPQEVDREVAAANQQASNLHFLPRTVYVDATDSFNVSRARRLKYLQINGVLLNATFVFFFLLMFPFFLLSSSSSLIIDGGGGGVE